MQSPQKRQTNVNRPLWEWIKIQGILKTKIQSRNTRVAVKTNCAFKDPNSVQENALLQGVVHLDFQKALNYEQNVGWNWHKSSNLPNLSIKIRLNDRKKEQIFICSDRIQARLYAVKIVLDNSEKQQKANFQDIGLQGQAVIEIKDGYGVFTGIKFDTTSYNNQGAKFYLLLVINGCEHKQELSRNRLRTKFQTNIIDSFLSPPIFVDSRKTARDYQTKKILAFVQLFDPDQIRKTFYVKKCKVKNNQQKEKIGNDFESLFNYLTAPNIRYKVKHPLFLSLRFSKAFEIFFNPGDQSLSYKKLALPQVLKKLQNKLIQDTGIQRKTKKCQNINQKSFLLKILADHDSAQRVKVFELLQFLNCQSMHLIDKEQKISQKFIKISEIGDVLAAYQNCYEQLSHITKKQIKKKKNTRKILSDYRYSQQQPKKKQDFERKQFKNGSCCKVNKEFEEKNYQNVLLQKQNDEQFKRIKPFHYMAQQKAIQNLKLQQEFEAKAKKVRINNQGQPMKIDGLQKMEQPIGFFSYINSDGQKRHQMNNQQHLAQKKVEQQERTINTLKQIIQNNVIQQKMLEASAMAMVQAANNISQNSSNSDMINQTLAINSALNSISPMNSSLLINPLLPNLMSHASQIVHNQLVSMMCLNQHHQQIQQNVQQKMQLQQFRNLNQNMHNLHQLVYNSILNNQLPGNQIRNSEKNDTFGQNSSFQLCSNHPSFANQQQQVFVSDKKSPVDDQNVVYGPNINNNIYINSYRSMATKQIQVQNLNSQDFNSGLLNETNKVKMIVSPYNKVRVQKIRDQINRIEIQNELYHLKIKNNKDLIDKLRFQAEKQEQRIQEVLNNQSNAQNGNLTIL